MPYCMDIYIMMNDISSSFTLHIVIMLKNMNLVIVPQYILIDMCSELYYTNIMVDIFEEQRLIIITLGECNAQFINRTLHRM